MPEPYRVIADIQLRFRDIDMLGHVNNAVFLSWLELGRMAYTEAVLPDIDWSRTGFILAHVSIDYLEPVTLHDKVKVHFRCSRIGSKSLEFEFIITKADANGQRTAAKGSNVIVSFDYRENRSVPIPEHWRSRVGEWEAI